MNVFDEIRKIREAGDPKDPFAMIEDELSEALSLYWSTAGRILEGGPIRLMDQTAGYLSLEGNFFSAIFLYSYHRAGIPRPRRILYAAVNQCLRGMVTGCDNLLDDEYKITLETDLPAHSARFRSVLDIMVSDRVLFEILFQWFQDGGLEAQEVLLASKASLSALTRSGVQEASEEGGVPSILPPEQVLDEIHHFKTGVLFQSPWTVPNVIEDLEGEAVPSLLNGLYQIGMGCQIMDDMVDLARDVLNRRHNYAASLLFHGPDPGAWSRLQALLASNPKSRENREWLLEFPHIQGYARSAARRMLEQGFGDLFEDAHRSLLEPAISFLSRRIGAERMMRTV
jgi:hypothetical protein